MSRPVLKIEAEHVTKKRRREVKDSPKEKPCKFKETPFLRIKLFVDEATRATRFISVPL